MPQFSSRPPFSGDPLPYRYNVATAAGIAEVRSATDPVGNREYHPRPELELPQTNPTNIVLTHVRDYWCTRGEKILAWQVKRYLDEVDIDSLGAPSEHVEHAHAVLTRAAALAPTRGTLDLRQNSALRPAVPPARPSQVDSRHRADEGSTVGQGLIAVLGAVAVAELVLVILIKISFG